MHMGLFEGVCVMFERAMFPDVFGHGNRAVEGLSLPEMSTINLD
jgi:hypothetical protein